MLTNDPGNTAARQGLNVIASKLVLQARTEIDGGRLDDAEQLLNEARVIDASNSELAATDAALANARDAIILQEQRRAEEARRQAEAKRQAEADRQAAEKARLEEQRLADEEAQAAAAVDEAPKETIEEPVEESVSAVSDDTIAADAAGQADKSVTDTATAAATDKPVSAGVLNENPVAISTLTRTKYSAPKYPRVAQRRNLSGWVSIEFTVNLDGSVRDVEVRDAEPEEIFDNAAIRAVQKWEFEPVLENGVAVEKRAGVRMMFALE